MLFISCFAGLLQIASSIAFFEQPNKILFNGEKEQLHATGAVNNLSSNIQKCSEANLRSFIIVSTIDGRLTCLDSSTGETVWGITSNNPLLSSSISYVKSFKDLADAHFIPSLDGNLYKWNGNSVETVPISTDYLLGHMSKLPDGSRLVGAKDILISGVDMLTGKLYYECSAVGCKAIEGEENIQKKNILLLRKTQQTVRSFHQKKFSENWNFSVGKFDLEFVEGDVDEVGSDVFCEQVPVTPNTLHFIIQDGFIQSYSDEWSFKFDSPIAAAWEYEENELRPIDIFQYGLLGDMSEKVDTSEVMYLGIHNGQMYIQQPLINENIDTFSSALDLSKQPRVDHWRPFISTSASRTPTMNHDKAVTSLSTLDYPFDNGFVLVANMTTSLVPVDKNDDNNDEYCSTDPYDELCESRYVPTAKPKITTESDLVPLNLKDWWKEILLLSVVIAVGLNIAARYLKRRLITTGELMDAEEVVEGQEVAVVEEENVAPIIPAPDTANKNSSFTNSLSIASDMLTGSSNSLSGNGEYQSRYMVDFEHMQCLGKGGFGVVFKAKKRIDDCEYAIKRIFLPRCDEAKEKMMREVKALATLDHSGIVRYFHAWWEAPPAGWQNRVDKDVLIKGRPETPSYALSQDWYLELHSVFPEDSEIESETKSTKQKQRRRTTVTNAVNDDPFGKRYNFDTGGSDLEDYLRSNENIDLRLHNDVFYSESTGSDKIKSNEDSFEICFEASGDNGNTNDEDKDGYVSDMSSLKSDTGSKPVTPDTPNVVNISHHSKKEESTRKKRVVGKCCTRNSSCLSEPPLFLYIQMQLCRQATLKEWLSERKDGVTITESMDIFFQIVDAVEYFHHRGMMHRDLKPANIFFSLDGTVKVGDFGLVTAITRPSAGNSKYRGKTFENENHTGQVGTQLYMSPEQACGQPYSQKVDIYALGLIFFELLCSFSTQMERIKTIYGLKRGMLPEKLVNTPQGLLVRLLTSENPDGRPDANEIKDLEVTKKIIY